MLSACYQIIARGRVQGVGFRYGTSQIAKKMDIDGSVENLNNGTVEIIAQGNCKILEQFIKQIKKGPTPYSKVTALQITKVNPEKLAHNFVIK